MNLAIAIATAIIAALAASALTRVMHRYVEPESRWLRSRLHIILATVGGFGAALLTEHPAVLVAFAAAAVGCSVLVVIDFAVHRLPDPIVAFTAGALLVLLGIAAATGDDGWGSFGRAFLAALVLVVGYFILAFISPAGLGLGDVKFASVIGLALGWWGWSAVAIGTVAGFLFNGLFALITVLRTRSIENAEVPFGPSMVLGAVAALALTG